ncbi:MAG: TonB family protein [Paludibacter sp.]|nr:TonB family protein [Paludibacter sp.]
MKVKKYIPFFLFIISIPIHAQDTTYFDVKNKSVETLKLAKYFRVIANDPTDSLRKTYKFFYLSGQLKGEYSCINLLNEKLQLRDIIDGKLKKWYENGNIQRETEYKGGKIDGLNLAYWENGQLKRMENYSNSKFINGKSYNLEGKEIQYSPIDEMPEFPGGEKALMNYISINLKYPVKMQKKGIQGKSILKFVVGKDGSITKIEIIRSATSVLDDEAIRVVKSLPKWKPGMLDGEPVSVYYTLPVNFKLEN